MWVWQSQAPAGISKFTGVEGWAALADAILLFVLFMVTPAAMEAEASRIARRVSLVFSLVRFRFEFALVHQRFGPLFCPKLQR